MSPAPPLPKRAAARAAGESEAAGQVKQDVEYLDTLVRQLEHQLRRLAALQNALEGDLADERERAKRLEHEAERLSEQIESVVGSAGDAAQLLETIARLSTERGRLSAEHRRLSLQLRALAEQRTRELESERQLTSLLSERALELEGVEAQLSRALDVMASVELQAGAATRERDGLAVEVSEAERRVAELKKERDALAHEVAESRAALDQMTRSLANRL